jgi:hypothetical protein
VNAAQVSVSEAIDEVASFIKEQNIRVLNVAGPRRSGWNGGHELAFNVIAGVIGTVRSSSAICGMSDETA